MAMNTAAAQQFRILDHFVGGSLSPAHPHVPVSFTPPACAR
jgi:hypothetical protein